MSKLKKKLQATLSYEEYNELKSKMGKALAYAEKTPESTSIEHLHLIANALGLSPAELAANYRVGIQRLSVSDFVKMLERELPSGSQPNILEDLGNQYLYG